MYKMRYVVFRNIVGSGSTMKVVFRQMWFPIEKESFKMLWVDSSARYISSGSKYRRIKDEWIKNKFIFIIKNTQFLVM